MAKHVTMRLGSSKHMIYTILSISLDVKFSPNPGGMEDASERVESHFSWA